MNKPLVFAVIVSILAGCSAPTSDAEASRSDAVEGATSLTNEVFVSDATFAYAASEQDYTGDYVDFDTTVRLRLRFVPATGFVSLDGVPGGLDYEVLLDRVDVNTGRTYTIYTTYFARDLGASSLQLFDCDRSRRCSTQSNVTTMRVGEGAAGRTLTVRSQGVQLIDTPETEIVFSQR